LSSPGDQNVIIGQTEIPIVAFQFLGGTAEDVKVTRIKLTGVSLADATEMNDDLSNIALYAGATRLTAKKGFDTSATTVTFSASDFLSDLIITKGQQKTITVKADIPSTADSGETASLGIASSTESVLSTNATTADVSAVGLSSNASIVPTLIFVSTMGGVNYEAQGAAGVNYATINAKGTMTAEASSDKPAIQMVTVGEIGAGRTGVTFVKVNLRSDLEDVYVKSIEIARDGGSDADFGNITLWDGTTQIGAAQSLVAGETGLSSTTFSLPVSSYWTLPKGQTKTLTVKADLKGIKTTNEVGTTPGDTPMLCVSAGLNGNLKVVGQGVSSGAEVMASSSDNICSNVQILYQSKPTLAAAALPSNTLAVGTQVLYRWTVTADEKGSIAWAKQVFDISGVVTSGGIAYTIGSGGELTTGTTTAAIWAATSTSEVNAAKELIATSTMKVYRYDSGSRTEVTASSSAIWVHNFISGGSRVTFLPAVEEVVAAGETKTYELEGYVNFGGVSGDYITTQIAQRSTATSTGSLYSTNFLGDNAGASAYSPAEAEGETFVWSDRSSAGASTGVHSTATSDWSWDYKVPGLPASPATLSR
jgi:hypothetical protein